LLSTFVLGELGKMLDVKGRYVDDLNFIKSL
jgi:hypothetical protein